LTAWLVSAGLLAGFLRLMSALRDTGEVVFGPPPGVGLAIGMWVAAAILSVALFGFTVMAWRRGWWQVAGRVCLTLLCLAAVGSFMWLHHWNLLGWFY
jgi:hypothetical protein